MLNIKTFACNMLEENCYVVNDESREAVVIDCGAFYPAEREAIASYIDSEQLTLRHVLCTHGHLDHCFGNQMLLERYGLHPEVSRADAFLADDLGLQARHIFGFDYQEPTPAIEHYLEPGELIGFGSHQFQVLPTPGHSPGSVVFYCKEESVVFTGDTLFRMSIGRTDFERGSWTDMMQSQHTVMAQLPPETKVYCGHGPATTMADELSMNPYLRA